MSSRAWFVLGAGIGALIPTLSGLATTIYCRKYLG